MEKDKLYDIIKDSLSDGTEGISMSSGLKDRILKSTVRKPETLYQRFVKLMNTTIQITIPSAAIACIVLVAIIFTGFMSVQGIKKDKSLIGYTDVKVVSIGGCDLIVDKNIGGEKDGLQNKN